MNSTPWRFFSTKLRAGTTIVVPGVVILVIIALASVGAFPLTIMLLGIFLLPFAVACILTGLYYVGAHYWDRNRLSKARTPLRTCPLSTASTHPVQSNA